MIHSKQLFRPIPLVAAVLTCIVATQAEAGFSLVENTLSITSPTGSVSTSGALTTVTFGGTEVGLTPITPQNPTGASNLNLLNIAAQSSTPTTSTADTGSFSFVETFTLTGNGSSVGFTEVATLFGTFNLVSGQSGSIISNFGTLAAPSSSLGSNVVSGSGFTITGFSYAAPSPSSSVGNPSTADGNVSVLIIPATAVPEPASLAMLGLGLLGVGVITRRRVFAR